MPTMTPTTPQRGSKQMFENVTFSTPYTRRSHLDRPMSEATEFMETDDDDDSSVFEEDSEHSTSSRSDSMDSRRQSQTTVSSYGVPTPRSSRDRPFEIMIKPVEGPKGPHLFRASQHSADFMFDSALQMSPILPKTVDPPIRAETAFSQNTVRTVISPRTSQPLPPIQTEFQSQSRSQSRPVSQRTLSAEPSQWTIQQVIEYMYKSEVADEVITKLQIHDINGSVLMHLQFEDLKELDIASFGKRHQLWGAIQSLKGGERGPSPVPTPFQDITRPCTNVRSKSDGDIPCSPCSASPVSPDATPISYSGHKKKRHHRKHRRQHRGEIEPGESVSIVAIEQVIPKPHECSKGEDCPTWRKRERLLNAIRKEQSMGGSGWPVSPSRGGHIMITGNPGNPSTAENLIANARQAQPEHRPTSEVVPSVVASSDLLGPGQLPEFALHEGMLQQLEHRDPQENVKNFLTFQHVTTGHVEEPPSPPLEMFPASHHQAFHTDPVESVSYIQRPGSVPLRRPSTTSAPHEGLKSLSKLAIPRSASANPHLGGSCRIMTPIESTMSPCHTATASPNTLRSPSRPNTSLAYSYRPGSEMDVPVTAIPVTPILRDNSQSVPPDMHYREPVSLQRSNSRVEWRRPSFAMPKLDEDHVFSTVSTVPPTTFPVPNKQQQKAQEKEHTRNRFGDDISHAGWMKKRKTKLLRHDWQDAHCRLHGTVLDLHESARLSAALLDTIDVDEYSVAVSTLASNSKLSAALKSLKLNNNADKKRDAAAAADGAFAFQLIPGEKDRAKFATGKTHHFTVKSSNERIDWMRELMLAKAKKQKDSGYTIEHNGEVA